ncbi:MAG: hypothetical protein ACI4PP_04040, partial [Clostridia bacterium]
MMVINRIMSVVQILLILNPDIIFKTEKNEVMVLNIENGKSFVIDKNLYDFLQSFNDNQDLSLVPPEIKDDLLKNGILIERENFKKYNFCPHMDSISRISLCTFSVDSFFDKHRFLLKPNFFKLVFSLSALAVIGGFVCLSLITINLYHLNISIISVFSKITYIDILILYLLSMFSLILHEMSHLYFYKYYGNYPGKIRLILLFLSPTLCCNLTGIYFLDRKNGVFSLIAGSCSQLVVNGI